MVNFGLLMAEICWRVWGTRANFNGFRVLAALLCGTLVVGVEQRAPPIFGRATITLGIGPHSSYQYSHYYQMCRRLRQRAPVCWGGVEQEAACCQTLHLVGW